MFANYQVNFIGQFTGRKLSRRVPGAHCDDLLNTPDNWMKNIVASGFFLVTLFLAVEEKVTGSKGFESKTRKDVGARQGINLYLKLAP